MEGFEVDSEDEELTDSGDSAGVIATRAVREQLAHEDHGAAQATSSTGGNGSASSSKRHKPNKRDPKQLRLRLWAIMDTTHSMSHDVDGPYTSHELRVVFQYVERLRQEWQIPLPVTWKLIGLNDACGGRGASDCEEQDCAECAGWIRVGPWSNSTSPVDVIDAVHGCFKSARTGHDIPEAVSCALKAVYDSAVMKESAPDSGSTASGGDDSSGSSASSSSSSSSSTESVNSSDDEAHIVNCVIMQSDCMAHGLKTPLSEDYYPAGCARSRHCTCDGNPFKWIQRLRREFPSSMAILSFIPRHSDEVEQHALLMHAVIADAVYMYQMSKVEQQELLVMEADLERALDTVFRPWLNDEPGIQASERGQSKLDGVLQYDAQQSERMQRFLRRAARLPPSPDLYQHIPPTRRIADRSPPPAMHAMFCQLHKAICNGSLTLPFAFSASKTVVLPHPDMVKRHWFTTLNQLPDPELLSKACHRVRDKRSAPSSRSVLFARPTCPSIELSRVLKQMLLSIMPMVLGELICAYVDASEDALTIEWIRRALCGEVNETNKRQVEIRSLLAALPAGRSDRDVHQGKAVEVCWESVLDHLKVEVIRAMYPSSPAPAST